MIDLSKANHGELGTASWLSDIFVSAIHAQFTGGVLVKAPTGDTAVFFRGGKPVHTGGPGFLAAFLGEVLVDQGLAAQAAVDAALQKQRDLPAPKPLLGTLLMSEGGLDPNDVKRAVQIQNQRRLEHLLSLTEGTWQSAPGENARIREIGVLTEAWPILLDGLEKHASDKELQEQADLLLGKAVKLARADFTFHGYEASGDEAKLLQYLHKPRKPDQLERALGDRKLVRGVLRILYLLGEIELLPQAKAIPIPKATLTKAQLNFTTGLSAGDPPRAPEPESPKKRAEPEAPPAVTQLAKEIRELHGELSKKNHFEVLGVDKKADLATVRKTFTQLAKKYHPDALPQGLAEDAAGKAREISARINEAYRTLSDDVARAEYVALLADDRIKGDARKAELIREAEKKTKMADVLLRKKDYQKAREYYRFAVESDPSSGEYKGKLAWAMFSDPSFDRKEALEKGFPLILDALQQAEKNALVHYYAGQFLRAQDRKDEALQHFQRAAKLDPTFPEAVREVRLADMRDKKTEEQQKGKSTFSKLFKRD